MKTVKTIALALLVLVLFAGCQSSEPVESVPEIVVPQPAPAVEAPAPAPVVEEEEAVVETAAPQETPITGTLSYAGYEVSYSAVTGKAELTYPEFITAEDIAAFFAYEYAKNPALLADVYFQITTPGQMTVTFPDAVTVADATVVVNAMIADLDAYLN